MSDKTYVRNVFRGRDGVGLSGLINYSDIEREMELRMKWHREAHAPGATSMDRKLATDCPEFTPGILCALVMQATYDFLGFTRSLRLQTKGIVSITECRKRSMDELESTTIVIDAMENELDALRSIANALFHITALPDEEAHSPVDAYPDFNCDVNWNLERYVLEAGKIAAGKAVEEIRQELAAAKDLAEHHDQERARAWEYGQEAERRKIDDNLVEQLGGNSNVTRSALQDLLEFDFTGAQIAEVMRRVAIDGTPITEAMAAVGAGEMGTSRRVDTRTSQERAVEVGQGIFRAFVEGNLKLLGDEDVCLAIQNACNRVPLHDLFPFLEAIALNGVYPLTAVTPAMIEAETQRLVDAGRIAAGSIVPA